jgi:hypothetical protein
LTQDSRISAAAALPIIPGTPRPFTKKVRRRSWLEPQVRIWWMCALLVFGIALYVVIDSSIRTAHHNALLREGVPLTVTIVSANDWTTPGSAQQRDHRMNVVLRSSATEGSREFRGALDAAPGYFVIGNQMKIAVDPHDDANWTELTEPLPLLHNWGVPLLLTPVIVAALAVAIARRWQILRIWREGVQCKGIVTARRHTAIAPFSSLVRYARVDGENNLVRSALFPQRGAVPQPGALLTLLAHPQDMRRTIVADVYQ